jgi:hypothetical protein
MTDPESTQPSGDAELAESTLDMVTGGSEEQTINMSFNNPLGLDG